MSESKTGKMFKFLFPGSAKKIKNAGQGYTPEMKFHQQLHDESEGGEFLDDVVEFEEPPSVINEENMKGEIGRIIV